MVDNEINEIKLLLANLFPIFFKYKNGIGLFSLCLIKTNIKGFNAHKIVLQAGEVRGNCSFWLKKGIPLVKGFRLNFYRIKFDLDSFTGSAIQNRLRLMYNVNGELIDPSVRYNIMNHKNSKFKIRCVSKKQATGESIFFRQSIKNTLYIVVRKELRSDDLTERIKILFAFIFSKLTPSKKLVILYEKESERYEESASVLFEKLIDDNHENVYFILNTNYEFYEQIEDKYKEYIIPKGSFKHYFNYFKCKTFMGTEALMHAVDLRIANRFAVQKLQKKDLNYVFLQHGVMYMVSLDTGDRDGFRKRDFYNKHKVVVSSKLEAKHFVDYAGFDYSDLYITGLPKYDRNVRNDNADKIVIMPTWRKWEVNQARADFTKTKYYELLMEIIDSIPDELESKIVVMPHPLMADALKGKDSHLSKYFPRDSKYDDVLKNTSILITDYSSIAYDAFYRGANVIFYWSQKEYSLSYFRDGAYLMIDENNIFGDICNNKTELMHSVSENYSKAHKEEYNKHYKEIVEFHDNKNTERLEMCLKRDGLI